MWQNLGLFVLGMFAGAVTVGVAIRVLVRFVIMPSEVDWHGSRRSPTD
jgi:hypothetical protein